MHSGLSAHRLSRTDFCRLGAVLEQNALHGPKLALKRSNKLKVIGVTLLEYIMCW